MEMHDAIVWSPGVTIQQIEYQVIRKAFRHYRENKTQTAKALGIVVNTLDKKLEEMKHLEEEETRAKEIRDRQREDFVRRSRGLPPLADADVSKAVEGIRGKSAPGFPEEPNVPMHVGQEVQEVLPRQASGNSQRRGR